VEYYRVNSICFKGKIEEKKREQKPRRKTNLHNCNFKYPSRTNKGDKPKNHQKTKFPSMLLRRDIKEKTEKESRKKISPKKIFLLDFSFAFPLFAR